MKTRKAYMPAGHLGTRRMGDLAELAFMYRAASEGIGVARPYGDSYPYDVLVQHGRRLSRIQVKSCFSLEKRRYTGFPIIVASHWRGKQVGYTIEEVDFIAAYIARYDAWYLIPIESLGKLKNIRLYPTGRKLKRPGGFYEKFREAWHLLKDEQIAKSESQAHDIPESHEAAQEKNRKALVRTRSRQEREGHEFTRVDTSEKDDGL